MRDMLPFVDMRFFRRCRNGDDERFGDVGGEDGEEAIDYHAHAGLVFPVGYASLYALEVAVDDFHPCVGLEVYVFGICKADVVFGGIADGAEACHGFVAHHEGWVHEVFNLFFQAIAIEVHVFGAFVAAVHELFECLLCRVGED